MDARASLNVREYSFSHREVSAWSRLPEKVVKSNPVNIKNIINALLANGFAYDN